MKREIDQRRKERLTKEEKREKSLAPPHLSHPVEHRLPLIGRHVWPVVLIHSLPGTAVEATDIEGFYYSKVKFGVFLSPIGDVYDVWTIDGGFTGLHVLSETGMWPSMLFRSFPMFWVSDSETSFCFADVVSLVLSAGVFIHPTFVQRVRFGFVA